MAMIRKIARKNDAFLWSPFSRKQMKIMTWWTKTSPVTDKFLILLDGAIRSGKTLPCSVSFVNWAMSCFSDTDFIVSGKTVGAFRRNVIQPWLSVLPSMGYRVEYYRTDGIVAVSKGKTANFFHVFGGDKENSQDKVQGFTVGGALLDEAPLMPRSFVNQVIARCSLDNAKVWMTSNPAHPKHWYKQDFIDKIRNRNGLYLRFSMDDNPSLSEEVKQRYKDQYSGVFYRRNILGEWCVADGLVYSDYRLEYKSSGGHLVNGKDIRKMIADNSFIEYVAGADWGYNDPMAASIWGLTKEMQFYKVAEYYKRNQLTDDLTQWFKRQQQELLMGHQIRNIYCDSAEADRIQELRKAGLPAIKASKEIKAGINTLHTLMRHDRVFFSDECKETDREYLTYSYPAEDALIKGQDVDSPIDDDNHLPDADRYCLHTYAKRYGGLDDLLHGRARTGIQIIE